ncbi:4-hydroxyphenylacetate 3-hydroxylase [Oceanobacillus piezotolerans]|uniref:4-hydroxyphenylacetate 3-hydroxylase n=1 Tax=Oceanobacillus piezotolerans TaxID=2448030 RepID=A0A498DDL6_9BACI|nr:4-hydroxyphenylacetate 3-hydroxylase N-terminal domain-containing protein [Oceanobacillus piezotolerans]RLL47057.1 4-hydroxyphenylacetate 3-hydroxylase [Oceanobacillus piezotolerans]
MTRLQDRLQDGRNVWYGGERVTHLVKHHAFKGTIQTIDRLLSLQHGELKEQLTFQSELNEPAHLSFLVPQHEQHLLQKARAYEIWVDATFGMMSRLSEYSREITTGWYANRNHLATIAPHIDTKLEAIYKNSRSHDLLSTVAAQDLQRNRSKSDTEQHGQLRIVKKTTEGVIVRGAKTIATAAPYVDEFIISSFHKRSDEQQALANVFIIPANLNGLQIICRQSFAHENKVNNPLSARFDEMDAVLIFENVLIPWELVLVHEDPDVAWQLQQDPIASALSQHQTVVRLVSKLKSVTAIALGLAKSADVTQFLHVQNMLAELIMQVETIQALLRTAQHLATEHNGVYIPNKQYLATARNLGTVYYPKGIDLIQQIGASGLLQSPATVEELQKFPEWQPYFTASDEFDSNKRTLLNKLAWDFFGSSLGSRHELYERFYSGDPVRTYANYYNQHPQQQALEEFATSIFKEALL